MGIRRGLSLLGVAATTLTGAALAAGPAAASSGGGCGITSYGVQGCISASGDLVKFDIYVFSSLPSDCTKITYTVLDDSTGRGDTMTGPCHTGHQGPASVLGLNGHRYHTSAVVWTASAGPMTPSSSPELYFAD